MDGSHLDMKNKARNLLVEDERETLKGAIKRERIKRVSEYLKRTEEFDKALDEGLPQLEINRRRKLMDEARQKIAPWLK